MVLFDSEYKGEERKLLVTFNRNGFSYLLDRESGEFLRAGEYVKQDWAIGIDEEGRRSAGRASCPPPRATKFIPAWPAVRIGCRLRSARRPI